MSDQVENDMSAEQAADLQRLMAAAGEPDVAAQQQVLAEQQEAQQATNGVAAQNAQALEVLIGLAGPTFSTFGFPSVERVLNTLDEGTGCTKGQMLANVWSAVLAKHGVDLGELGGQWKEEISAVFVTLPIGFAIYQGIKNDCRPGDGPAPAGTAPQAAALKAVQVDGVAVVHK
jgi:hypothetical protein